MNHQYYNVLGVMSGTSLDGIDIAHIELKYSDRWHFKILNTHCAPYSDSMLRQLKDAINYNESALKEFNHLYTQHLGRVLNDFITRYQISNLLAICSHGHTIKHQPAAGYTLQIGNLKELASLTGHRVVCDFRTADVALGGQGAPLVPIGDRLLFKEYEYCLNLGGFANVSFEHLGNRIAYDLSPVNVVLNHYALKLGKTYDDGGAFAKAGTVNPYILNQLNLLPYYQQQSPKSLGMEWVSKNIMPLLQTIKQPQDALATFTQHTATQIAKSLIGTGKVLCTGGGTYNKYLMQQIQEHTTCHLVIPEGKLIEYKEALIFAFLGVLRLRNATNCLSSVTGARKNHCSGTIFIP
jgi:anhydro-N-acetylmuramic acid kinase